MVEPTLKKTRLALILTLILVLSYLLIKNILTSVFIKNRDRVNVVFYSRDTSFFSFSKQDVNYMINFPASIEVLVPGGYGLYKVGALGKLVSLERKPDILRKTFASATSSLVDLYFYSGNPEIYYQSTDQTRFPSMSDILFSKSNATMLDRLILARKLLNNNQADYRIISLDKGSFDRDEFNKDYQGSFYKKINRTLDDTVQILYTHSYSTAFLISQIIDGEGTRVVDLSESDAVNTNTVCKVVVKNIDIVSQDLANYFGCQIKTGATTVSDIILELGSLEKDWAVK